MVVTAADLFKWGNKTLAYPKKAEKDCFQQCNKTRHFQLVPDRTVVQDNIPALEIILGKKKLSAFSVCGDKENLITFQLSYFCNACVNGNYDACTKKEVVGEVKNHNLVKKVTGINFKRDSTEGGRGAATKMKTGTSVHFSLLEEVSSTSTIVKYIEDIAVKKGMLT